MFGDIEPGKKHTSEECLAFALEEIKSNPNLVKFHVNLLLSYDLDLFNTKLWPSVSNPDDYTRTSTKRPSAKELNPDADSFYGTDVVIRTFENDVWDEESRQLILTVKEEQSELSLEVKVVW